jgi:hypothetical protein
MRQSLGNVVLDDKVPQAVSGKLAEVCQSDLRNVGFVFLAEGIITRAGG